MSTISFPDWINSLSPQSTDGKEIYQQDGSTPSRGDLDDKASLSAATDDVNITGGRITLPDYRFPDDGGKSRIAFRDILMSGNESITFRSSMGFRGSGKVIITGHEDTGTSSNRIYGEFVVFRGREVIQVSNNTNLSSTGFGSIDVLIDGSRILIEKTAGSSSGGWFMQIMLMGSFSRISEVV